MRGSSIMDDQKFANQLVELIGGKENIRAVGHCSTRLRLTLHDKSKVDEEKIENLLTYFYLLLQQYHKFYLQILFQE